MKGIVLAILSLVIAACTASHIPQGCSAPGCPVPLQTEQGQSAETVCEGVRLGGILTADAIYGLGIRGDASVQGVVWPTGYTARRDANGIVLLDRSGRVAAREGERIALDGVVDRDGINRICWDPEIEVSR